MGMGLLRINQLPAAQTTAIFLSYHRFHRHLVRWICVHIIALRRVSDARRRERIILCRGSGKSRAGMQCAIEALAKQARNAVEAEASKAQ